MTENEKGNHMRCAECGVEIPENAHFCKQCGAKQPERGSAADNSTASENVVESEEAPEASAASEISTSNGREDASAAERIAGSVVESSNAPAVAKAVAAAGDSKVKQAAKSMDPKKRKIIIGAVAAAIVAIIAIVAWCVVSANNVPNDKIESAFRQSDIVKNGVVPSDFVNDSAYQVKSFKVEKQEDAYKDATAVEINLTKALVGSDTLRKVTFSATIANDNFETKLTGKCYFAKDNNTWNNVGVSSPSSSETKPLKGVDLMEKSNSNLNSSTSVNGGSESITDLNSTIDESDGTYTSQASETKTIDYWFATDTATASRVFTFDQKQGWVASGNVSLDNESTEWKLKGQKFKCVGSDSRRSNTATLEFADCTENGVSANYTIVVDPKESANDQYSRYSSVNASGTASGKITHKFNSADFSLKLTDSDQQVTFDCSNNSVAVSNSTDGNPRMRVDLTTPFVSVASVGGIEINLTGTGMIFVRQ